MFNKSSKNRTLLVLLMLLSLLLIACGGDDDDGDDGDSDNNNDTPSVELSQSFDEEGFSLSYPEGWVVESHEGRTFFATSSEIIQAFRDVPMGGDVEGEGTLIDVSIIPGESFPMESPQGAFDALSAAEDEEGIPPITWDDMTEFNIDGFEAGGRGEISNDNGRAVLYAVQHEAVWLLIVGYSDDFGGNESLMDSIVRTASYTAPSAE